MVGREPVSEAGGGAGGWRGRSSQEQQLCTGLRGGGLARSQAFTGHRGFPLTACQREYWAFYLGEETDAMASLGLML